MKNKLFILLSIILLSIPFGLEAQQDVQPYRETFINEGIKITLSIDHIDEQKIPGYFTEGDDVRFRFSITETSTGKGLSGLYPAAWGSLVGNDEEEDCIKKVESFISGSLFAQPELDLNTYYVLTLNAESTVSVVDPLFSYGGSSLLSLIQLNSPGIDWVVSNDQQLVFVSMPKARQIAVINTNNWNVVKNIDLKTSPQKVMLQASGKYLWVVCQGDANKGESSSLAVIEVNTASLLKNIPIGDGDHAIQISDDDKFVYVTNKEDNNLMVIDATSMKSIAEVPTGLKPSSLDYSSAEKVVYIISEETGKVTVVDAEKHTISGSIPLAPGICQIKFEPRGRYAFIINAKNDTLSIVNAAIHQVVQVGDVESDPDQISFTESLAYIRHRNSELVLMIPLDGLGNMGRSISIVDFPGGQYPPGKMSSTSLAPGIVQAPGESAVLVANASDKAVYYYKEGMAAPMGSFNNYNQEPTAVIVIDRSLREIKVGNYETVAKLKSPGLHKIAFFMDSPRILNCFSVSIQPDPEQVKLRDISINGALKVNYLPPLEDAVAGKEFLLNFSLVDKKTNQARSDLSDVETLSIRGAIYVRKSAQVKTDGTYSAKIIFREPGLYFVYVGSSSGGLPLNNSQYHQIRVLPSSK